jgi:hypothetical protein
VDSAILELDALGCEPNDRVVLDVHNVDVWSIELLVVVELETGAFDAKRMRRLQRC